MEIKIYADVLFFTNFAMDFIILHICCFLLEKKCRLLRVVISSCFGALYATVVFFLSPRIVFSLFSKAVLSCLMVFIALVPKKISDFLKDYAVFLAVTLVLGGGLFAFFSSKGITSALKTVISGGVFYIDIPIYAVFGICVICMCLFDIASISTKNAKEKKQLIHNVTIEKDGRKVRLSAFLDTGNFLKNKEDNLGFLITSKKNVSSLFESENSISLFSVPYKSAGASSFLYAFCPDRILVDGKETKMYVALCDIEFKNEYDALLPNDLFLKGLI